MNSKERMITTFQHKEPDMVPVGDTGVDPPVAKEILGKEVFVGRGGWLEKQKMQMIQQGLRDEYAEKYMSDTVELYSKLDVDFMIVELLPPKNFTQKIEFLSDIVWKLTDEKTGMWSQYMYEKKWDTFLETDSSIKQAGFEGIEKHLDIIESGGFKANTSTVESIEYCKKKLGDTKFIFGSSPLLFPSASCWYTTFMEMIYAEPDLTQRFFDVYLKNALAYIKEYIRAGIDALFVTNDWAFNPGPIFSPEIIRKYLIPQVRAICDLCHEHGVYVVKHTDGNIMKIADDFFGMGIDGYQSVDPYAGMQLSVVKEKYGDKITFMGNVDAGRTLPFGTREEIMAEVKQCIKDGAKGGGYVVTSSNTISGMIPAKNFLTMIEAARKYGRYPIEL